MAGTGKRAGFIGDRRLQLSSAVPPGKNRVMVVAMETDFVVVLVVAVALSLASPWIILDCDRAGRCLPV